MNFNDQQLNRFASRPKTPPNANDWGDLFNPVHEEILGGMFGRIDDPLDNFPAGLVSLRSSLFAPVIGRTFSAAEIPMLLSCASQVTNPRLVLRCLYALESTVRDEKFDTNAHQLYSDAQRVLEDLKARHPEVVKARENSRQRLREQKDQPN